MTPEERIAQLEALVAEKDRLLAVQAQALADAMAAVRAAADDRKAIESRRAADRERRRRADRARLERSIEQAASRDVSMSSSREAHVSGFPPPLEGSPPPSDPSSPSPISSPPSLSSPSAAPRNELRLVAQEAPRQAKKPKPEKATDPRHAPLVKALVEEVGFPFDGPKDAAHVKGLLALADQREATSGAKAPAEVLRRARIAWEQFPGFNSARTLGDFRAHWGRFEQEERRAGAGPPPVSDWSHQPEMPPPPDFDDEDLP